MRSEEEGKTCITVDSEGPGGAEGAGFRVSDLAGKEDKRRGRLSPQTCFGEEIIKGHLTRDVQQAGRNEGVELEREDLEGIFFL